MEEVEFDSNTSFDIANWLRSEEAGELQRDLEERIIKLLFNDPAYFEEMAVKLAWLGSDPINRPIIEREIAQLKVLSDNEVVQCGFSLKKAWKGTCSGASKVAIFVSSHSTEILVGAAICATGAGIACLTGYTLSAAVGGVVVAGANSIFTPEEKPNPRIPNIAPPTSTHELALASQGLPSSIPNPKLPASANEFLVTSQGVWANGQYFPTDELMQHSLFRGQLGHTPPHSSIAESAKFLDFGEIYTLNNVYQARGERALLFGSYEQAVEDLNQAIERNPTPKAHLQRGAAQFALGQYESSLEDYQTFEKQTDQTVPLAINEFNLGFSQGVTKGAYESGKGVFLFLVEFVQNPIHTSIQVADSLHKLSDLAKENEWGLILETLVPEVSELVEKWDTLPPEERGNLAGCAFGKLGADIFVPGAVTKLASKSAKTAQKLATVCKDLQIAQETLVLETATGVGGSVKIAEVIEAGKKTANLAEELGFTRCEMAKLKEAGKLEATIGEKYGHLSLSMQESLALHNNAKIALKPYVKRPMPEAQVRALIHETGLPTFPRPKGIPEDYLVMIVDKGGGMEYVHPTNNHLRIRVMPGKPHSPNVCQQKPYVIQKTDKGTIDNTGKIVSSDVPEAHIPLQDFIYRDFTNGY